MTCEDPPPSPADVPLGWGSAALTRALQAAAARWVRQAKATDQSWLATLKLCSVGGLEAAQTSSSPLSPAPNTSMLSTTPPQQVPSLAVPYVTSALHCVEGAASPPPSQVRHYPTLGAAMLRHGVAATGRLWLLCRGLDDSGRGWLSLASLRQQLTEKESRLHLCGKRRLRQLLREGEGLFWQRDKTRLWLAGVATVARRLGVERLTGQPVWLPLARLLAPIADVRAELYAAFHSGRRADTPISRAALTEASGAEPRSQQRYERRAGVQVQSHIALGARYSKAQKEELLWRKGQGFVFIDRRGQFGPAGQCYCAWRLPNSYQRRHQMAAAGRQKKHNRRIDLVTRRAQGNGRRCFFHQAAAAWRSALTAEETRYWPAGKQGVWLATG